MLISKEGKSSKTSIQISQSKEINFLQEKGFFYFKKEKKIDRNVEGRKLETKKFYMTCKEKAFFHRFFLLSFLRTKYFYLWGCKKVE